MTDPEFQKKLDGVKEAMERIRSGASEEEVVEVPSGGKVRLTPDDEAATGVRVQVVEGEEGSPEPRKPDPDQKAAFKRIEGALARMKSGESQEEEITLSSGESMRVMKDPDVPGALIMESAREGNRFRAWTLENPREKPASYPQDLPFVAEASVTVSTITAADGQSSGRTVTWMKPPDLDQALASIRSQLVAEGWEEGEKTGSATVHGPVTGYAFRKEDRSRQVMVMAFGPVTQIMLMEKMGEVEGE